MPSLSKFVITIFLSGLALNLQGCTTTSKTKQTDPDQIVTSFPNPDVENPGIIVVANPELEPKVVKAISAPPPPASEPPEVRVYELPKEFAGLDGWLGTDIDASLQSFRNSCQSWKKADQNALKQTGF